MNKPKKKHKLPKYIVQKNGQWHVRLNFPRIVNGKRIYKQVTQRCDPETEEQAQRIINRIKLEYHRGPVVFETLNEFVDNFITAKTGSVEKRTVDDYRTIYDRYIKDTDFSLMDVKQVSPLDIQRFYASLKVSPKMVRRIHTILSMAFNQGVKWETVHRNPCKGVILPRVTKTEISFLTQDEAQRFMRVCLDKYLVLAFALETGMRPGEYLALRWTDIDGDIVRVTRSVAFEKSGKYYYKDPKTTAGKRTIHISDTLQGALLRHKEKQKAFLAEIRAKANEPILKAVGRHVQGVCIQGKYVKGRNYEKRKTRQLHCKRVLRKFAYHNLVFPSLEGTPQSPTNLAIREMREACEAAEIGHRSLYSLRHTSLSLLLASGADIKTVSERAGHADVSVTLNTYIHSMPSRMLASVAKFTAELYGEPA